MSSPVDENGVDAELCAMFSTVGTGEPVTTTEIAARLDRDPQVVADRLESLATDSRVESKPLDGSDRIWWRSSIESESDDRESFEASGSLARRVVEVIGEPVLEIDAAGTVVAVNKAFATLVGYGRESVHGRPLSTIGPDDVVDRIDERLQSADDETTSIDLCLEFELETADGSAVPVSASFGAWRGDDGNLLGAVGVVRDERDRHEREATLARQQERLAVLNGLNDVVRDVTAAALEGSTRDEIERAVCDRLVASDAYVATWVAEVDPIIEELTPRVERGFDGYVDSVTISTDPDSPHGQGPAGRAARTMEPQACRDVCSHPAFEPWLDELDAHDITSCMAIPIVHGSTLYGLLGVYSSRTDAFGDDERAVVGQLGETVGHAISAAERKRAMTSDEVIEIGLQCRGFFASLGLETSFTGTATFRQTIPIGDGSYVLYGNARDGGLSAIEILVDAEETPHYESYEVISRDGEETTFKAHLSDAPIPSVVSANGGYVDDVQLVDGDMFTRVHLPPGADINRLVEDIQACYPDFEPVTRRQKSIQRRTGEHYSSILDSILTERQLAAIEAGYHAGFFEWPRHSSGEDVAETLDISPATFHQHIRTAERKILDELLDE
ncbi:bacterio-opsin activator domain-containing protein [Halovivax cerinus]|uniref:Bacterio-opsin activator domain-containing protein n=1 Tax=Halovivax cerinus TaxID=1487865 RepID=A0ABD5NKS7_9EURY|nr:bacterio-opsin activator domain-containing protein [Halovivax cerinus]